MSPLLKCHTSPPTPPTAATTVKCHLSQKSQKSRIFVLSASPGCGRFQVLCVFNFERKHKSHTSCVLLQPWVEDGIIAWAWTWMSRRRCRKLFHCNFVCSLSQEWPLNDRGWCNDFVQNPAHKKIAHIFLFSINESFLSKPLFLGSRVSESFSAWWVVDYWWALGCSDGARVLHSKTLHGRSMFLLMAPLLGPELLWTPCNSKSREQWEFFKSLQNQIEWLHNWAGTWGHGRAPHVYASLLIVHHNRTELKTMRPSKISNFELGIKQLQLEGGHFNTWATSC